MLDFSLSQLPEREQREQREQQGQQEQREQQEPILLEKISQDVDAYVYYRKAEEIEEFILIQLSSICTSNKAGERQTFFSLHLIRVKNTS